MGKGIDLDKIESLRASVGSVTLQAAPAIDGVESRPKLVIAAYNGGPMRPSRPYLPAPLIVDLAGVTVPDTGIAILFDHDDTAIVGQSTDVRIDASSITVEGIATGNIENEEDPAGKVVMHAKNGFIWKASIDMEIERLEEVEPGTSVVVNGKAWAGPLYVVRAGKLDGVSLLSIGADRTTSTKIAARAAEESKMELEFHEWLKAKEFDPAALSDTQRDTLLKQYEREGRDDDLKVKAKKSGGGEPTQDDFGLSDVKARVARQKAIRAHVVKYAEEYPNEIELIEAAASDAIRLDQSPEMYELSLLRQLRGAPGINTSLRSSRSSKDQPIDQKVYEAALCMAGKLPNIEKQYDERTLEAANKKWRSGLGLGQLMIYAAKANANEDFTTHRDVAPLLRAAFMDNGRLSAASGPSTMDVSGILSNVANKYIVNYFNSVNTAWRSIAKIRSVSDFKQISTYSLNGNFEYDEIAPGGEIKHGTASETSYTNQAKSYGRMFGIDRRDIVNDDLGAFQGVMQKLGVGGATRFNNVFWAAFLDNATFFTTATGSAYANAAAALSLSALEYAETLFMDQTDTEGNPLGIMPAILLVPHNLKRTALRLMNSTELRQLADSDESTDVGMYGTSNTFAGDFRVVSAPHVGNTSLGGSTTTWYLLANPNELPVIEACFLNGVERPTVESAQADFDSLGIKMRGYFDFGVAKQEYRGGVRMALA